MEYEAFLASKSLTVAPVGFMPTHLPPRLFPFQHYCTTFALTRGRAALFLSTGLGKTACQLAWADEVVRKEGPVLILAPLAVTAQTAAEGALMGIDVTVCRAQSDVRPGINITNYDRLHHFDVQMFSGVVLDESSILKAFDGKTRTTLIETFSRTPYRLCCTATPAPNDHMELGNHAEFLGIMSRTDMLTTFFVHDGWNTHNWRLKRHATDAFWAWVASWAIAALHPRELGDETPGYDLPPLTITEHVVSLDVAHAGLTLFPMEAQGLTEQRAAKRASLTVRCDRAIELLDAVSGDVPFVVWNELNDEQDDLAHALKDRCISIYGSLQIDEKEARLLAWLRGDAPILLSKVSICGFGVNMQRSCNILFVGVDNSYEKQYQAIRRCWRYGQMSPVTVGLIYSSIEGGVVRNLRRKEIEAEQMRLAMTNAVLAHHQRLSHIPYEATTSMTLPQWLINNQEALCASSAR